MPDITRNTKVYKALGGNELIIASGGKITIEAGGVFKGAAIPQVAQSTVTLAQLNAGATLVAGVAGQVIHVVQITLVVTGAVTTATAVTITDTAGTVTLGTWAVAGLTDGARLNTNSTITNQTIGAGLDTDLAAGQGLTIQKTGSTATVNTSTRVTIHYTIT